MATLVAPYMVRIHHNAGTYVRAWMNDLPMYDRALMDSNTAQLHGTPWLVPGENDLVIEVYDAPKNPETPSLTPYFELVLYLDADDPADEQKLLHIKYPELIAELEPAARRFPILYRVKFTPQGHIPDPIWKDAAPETIPETGTPELWKAVHRMHDAFARRDLDAFVDAGALKLEDQARYLGPGGALTLDGAKREHAEMMEQPWDLKPFEPEKLHFRSCQGGRVAYATHGGAAPAIFAKHRTAPQTFKLRPLLVRQGAEWRIFR